MSTSTLTGTSSRLILSLLITAGLTACVNPAPIMDDNFGNTVNAAKAAQIINPDASLNTDPVAGMDGQAADAAMQRYHRSFTTPVATPSAFTIGVGSGGGAMTGGGAGGTTTGTSR